MVVHMKPKDPRLEIYCADELGHPTVILYVEIDLDGGLCLVTADGEWRAEVAPAHGAVSPNGARSSWAQVSA